MISMVHLQLVGELCVANSFAESGMDVCYFSCPSASFSTYGAIRILFVSERENIGVLEAHVLAW